MWRGRRNDSAVHVTSSEWCVSKTRRTLLGCSDLSTRRVTNLLRTDVRQRRSRSALFTRSDEGYIGMGGFQATTFTVISSLLAFSKVGCASAQRSGLAKTRTMGAYGRRFAVHRGIESVRISIIRRGRAKRSTPPPSRGIQLL